jgi:hypothetical protein
MLLNLAQAIHEADKELKEQEEADKFNYETRLNEPVTSSPQPPKLA